LAVLNREVSASVADRLPWEHGAMGANRKGQVKKQGQKEGQVDKQNEVNNRMVAFLYYVFVRCCICFAQHAFPTSQG
jgi:hypothetical protein